MALPALAAASLVAEVAAWRKHDFCINGSALGSAAAVSAVAVWRRWSGGSGGSAAGSVAAAGEGRDVLAMY